jgi:L-iditol 2-dehydrogenase
MTAPQLTAPATFTFVAAPKRDPDALLPGEALVRVRAGGICGSDLPLFRGAPVPAYARAGAPPVGYPMHEIVGDLVAVGPETSSPAQIGQRVVGWATGFDGLADVVVTGASSLAPCPDGWEPEQGVLIQPLACVLYAVERLGDVRGRHCAVLGLGSIGLLFCHVLKSRGAAKVTGVDWIDRRDVGCHLGIDEVHWSSSEQWAARLDTDRPEIVVEAVGHQVSTLHHALVAAAPSGLVFYFGVNDDAVYPLDMGLMLRKDLTLMSGGTQQRRRMLEQAAQYLAGVPQLATILITHRFARADVQRAYDMAAAPARGKLKVVITIGQDES